MSDAQELEAEGRWESIITGDYKVSGEYTVLRAQHLAQDLTASLHTIMYNFSMEIECEDGFIIENILGKRIKAVFDGKSG